MNRSYLNRSLLMLKSESSLSNWNIRTATASIPLLRVLAAFLILLPPAFGQGAGDFAMQAVPFYPDAVNPGGTAYSNITVLAGTGFSGTVSLACQVAPQTGVTPPMCAMSPTTVETAGGATATITTNATSTNPTATPGLYTMTITGTALVGGTSTTHPASPLNLTVLAVAPQFTITVATAVVPASVPAGSGGQGTIEVNPLDGYSGTVTLACSSITPLVTIPPVCSFNPSTVAVNRTTATSTLMISTQGLAVPRGAVAHANPFYAFCLSLPMLAVMGLGAASSKRGSRKAWGLLALFVVSGALLLMPACGNSSSTTTNPNGVTPNNTYTFTLLGVDTNGVTSSNTGTGTTNPTVSLTVTSPPKP
jgi:hypothetical protein